MHVQIKVLAGPGASKPAYCGPLASAPIGYLEASEQSRIRLTIERQLAQVPAVKISGLGWSIHAARLAQ